MRKFLLAGLSILLLSACGMEVKHLSTHGKLPSSIKVVNLLAGEELSIDQRVIGVSGRKSVVTELPDGWHVARIAVGDKVVLEQRIFLQDGIQKVLDARVR
jgi:hypothetical protein